MAFMILDTEGTPKVYNIGYMVIDENANVLAKEDILIYNRFEDPRWVGEATRKTKEKYYKTATKLNPSETVNKLKKVISKYSVECIIAHNAPHDKKEIEALKDDTGIAMKDIPFYDSINILKFYFPSDRYNNLQDSISNLAGMNIRQRHTALADCELIYLFIKPLANYLKYFITYKEVFDNDNDYEITEKFFMNFSDDIYRKLPLNIKKIQSILKMDENSGDKKKVSNFLKKYTFWTLKECIEFSEKTGRPLKTPGLELCENTETHIALEISKIFSTKETCKDLMIKNAESFFANNPDDEDVKAEIEKYKAILKKEFESKLEEINKEYSDKQIQLSNEYQNKTTELENNFKEKEYFLTKEISEKEKELGKVIASKIEPLITGVFNSKRKYIKNLIKSDCYESIYEYFK